MTHVPGSRIILPALCACALFASLIVPASRDAARAKGHPEMAWSVLAPVGYKNLTIFPLRANDVATDAYITLDEGTKNGTVVIAERGSAQAANRHARGSANRQVQQAVSYNEGASVNELALVNRSGKKLLLSRARWSSAASRTGSCRRIASSRPSACPSP